MISGIIYAIIDDGYFYIGSTTSSLTDKLEEHKTSSEGKSKNSKFYKYIRNVRGGWNDILILPLETILCETEKELQNKEMIYILQHSKDPFCLNVIKTDPHKYIINRFYKKT